MAVFLSACLYFAFSVLAFARLSAGKNCETLDGKWYNQLGSEVVLKHENDGTLLGEYRTAVERYDGSSGKSHSTVLGKQFTSIFRFCSLFLSTASFPR